jgi:hypothetical protein
MPVTGRKKCVPFFVPRFQRPREKDSGKLPPQEKIFFPCPPLPRSRHRPFPPSTHPRSRKERSDSHWERGASGPHGAEAPLAAHHAAAGASAQRPPQATTKNRKLPHPPPYGVRWQSEERAPTPLSPHVAQRLSLGTRGLWPAWRGSAPAASPPPLGRQPQRPPREQDAPIRCGQGCPRSQSTPSRAPTNLHKPTFPPPPPTMPPQARRRACSQVRKAHSGK